MKGAYYREKKGEREKEVTDLLEINELGDTGEVVAGVLERADEEGPHAPPAQLRARVAAVARRRPTGTLGGKGREAAQRMAGGGVQLIADDAEELAGVVGDKGGP